MKTIKKILKSIAVAFSIYSKIPMPRFNWESEDMKYHFVFFPFVGLFAGVVEYLWFRAGKRLETDPAAFGMIAAFIIIVITGGLHIDGFMDTQDALKSYGDKEKKLEILKDPHIGAFSVICLVGMTLLYVFAASEIYRCGNEKEWIMISLCLAASRAVSGLCVLNMKNARESGMSRSEADNSDKKTVSVLLSFELALLAAVMLYISLISGALVIILGLIVFFYFKRMIKKQFGGITGDLAGYFVCIFETAQALLAAVLCIGGIA